jgi:hypothetical protein
MSLNALRRRSGTGTTPTFGSIVQNGKLAAGDTRFGQRIEQGRLADVGQADDAAFDTHVSTIRRMENRESGIALPAFPDSPFRLTSSRY